MKYGWNLFFIPLEGIFSKNFARERHHNIKLSFWSFCFHIFSTFLSFCRKRCLMEPTSISDEQIKAKLRKYKYLFIQRRVSNKNFINLNKQHLTTKLWKAQYRTKTILVVWILHQHRSIFFSRSFSFPGPFLF